MPHLSYTIFADAACATVRGVANLYGDRASAILQAFRNVAKSEPKEGQIIAGCRIDCIST